MICFRASRCARARAWFIGREIALRGLAATLESLKDERLRALAAAIRAADDFAQLHAAVKAARIELRNDMPPAVAKIAYACAYAYAYAYADAYAEPEAIRAFVAKRRSERWEMVFGVLRDALAIGKSAPLDATLMRTRLAKLADVLAGRSAVRATQP